MSNDDRKPQASIRAIYGQRKTLQMHEHKEGWFETVQTGSTALAIAFAAAGGSSISASGSPCSGTMRPSI